MIKSVTKFELKIIKLDYKNIYEASLITVDSVFYVPLLISQLYRLSGPCPSQNAHRIATDLAISLAFNIMAIALDLKITSAWDYCKNLLADTKNTNGKFCYFYKMWDTCFIKVKDTVRRLLWITKMVTYWKAPGEIELEEEQTEAKLEALLKESTLVISLHDINLFEEKEIHERRRVSVSCAWEPEKENWKIGT